MLKRREFKYQINSASVLLPLSRSIEFIRVQLRSFAFNSVYAGSGGFMRGHAGPCGEMSTFKRKPLLEEAKLAAKLAKERRDALQNSNSFRDDNFNPLSGSSEGGPVRFRNTQNCGPRGG